LKINSSTVFVTAASISILIAVATGLATIGPPADIRLQRLDDVRSQDLQNIANTIRAYRLSHESVPDRLESIKAGGLGYPRLTDIETGSTYGYRAIDASSYELCARFGTVSDETRRPFGDSIFWKHSSGNHCFTIQANGPRVGDGRGVTF
jgi:hypothetical protein